MSIIRKWGGGRREEGEEEAGDDEKKVRNSPIGEFSKASSPARARALPFSES